jgi:hypothetical protein
MRDSPTSQHTSHASLGMLFVRYGIGWGMVLAGIVLLIVSPGGFGTEGFGMATGGGLAVLLLNFLYRMGVSGEREREQEERARRYFDQHGEWPEDEFPSGQVAGHELSPRGRSGRIR